MSEMSCDACRAELGAWNDGQLTEEKLVKVQRHLRDCSDCQAMADELQDIDRQLRAAFGPNRDTAPLVARRVANQLPLQDIDVRAGAPASVHWLTALGGLAAGLLGAIALLQPWQPAPDPVAAVDAVVVSDPMPVAQVSVTTGNVQAIDDQSLEWFQCAAPSRLRKGSRIRTGDRDLCELQTRADATIRLASQTELSFEDEQRVSLETGRLWCQSPAPKQPLSVATPNGAVSVRGTCDISHKAGMTEILVLEGEAAVEGGKQRLTAPRRARLADDNVVQDERSFDPIIATRWIHELLVQKDSDDSELQQRVDQLLSAIGRAKISYLYEDELRSLGPSCANPLIAFVRSSAEDPQEAARRVQAARILADVAGPTAIPRLIQLLADRQGEVRFHVARCLSRLAGRDFGITPEMWRDLPSEQVRAAVSKWEQWYDASQEELRSPAERLRTKA